MHRSNAGKLRNKYKQTATAKDKSSEKATELGELKVHFIDVGQGDSSLIQYNHEGENYSVLIDPGNWTGDKVVHYLQTQKVSQIDVAIGTHLDSDHIGQMDKVLNTFAVGEVWLSGKTSNSHTFQRLLKAIHTHHVDYYEPRMRDEFEIGPLQIDILYPKTLSEMIIKNPFP